MGRAKLQMRRIENNTSRHITFSKRRSGILKKAYELSTLCDIDIALLMFSPASRLTQFSVPKRIEDVLDRFAILPDRERENALAPQCMDQEHLFGILQDREHVMSSLNQLRYIMQLNNVDTWIFRPLSTASEIEELWQEIGGLQKELVLAEEHLRMYEPESGSMKSVEELETCEELLEAKLISVIDRKDYLVSSSVVPSYINL